MKKLLACSLVSAGAFLFIMIGAVSWFYASMFRANGKVVTSGDERTYLLYIPDSYDPAKPAPLVISLHGLGEWPEHLKRMSHWNELADEYGFIVVYPRGTDIPLRWYIFGRPIDERDSIADITFISDLIDALESKYRIDPARIYVNGMSNGGGMSFILACRLSERIAAFGSVAGAYVTPWSRCQFTRPVPAIIFHGTADQTVPFLGKPRDRFGLIFPDIPKWVKTLAERNGCNSKPTSLHTKGDVSGIHYTSCTDGADVIFYTITGGGHTWPGGRPVFKPWYGFTTREIDATRLMWAFFQEHPLRP